MSNSNSLSMSICPFCDHSDIFIDGVYCVSLEVDGFAVTCDYCHSQGPFSTNKSEAVRLWNEGMNKHQSPLLVNSGVWSD